MAPALGNPRPSKAGTTTWESLPDYLDDLASELERLGPRLGAARGGQLAGSA